MALGAQNSAFGQFLTESASNLTAETIEKNPFVKGREPYI